ncbi:DUF488 domain-containing protein [Thauera sinica]|uniref:DUF488 domain-containing protein n=1 Tax=Thauera sinica TaxID=2665146 RepID=A0ABW1ARJ7_9RHOO|nr:DUF488 domain-containing protein [Thauera sp. K11]ATE62174.1 hypothetical protein CCZ27_21315 [Thauera sp. K11]
MRLSIKRVYAPPEEGDGFRVLIDRLWPRGLAKEKAGVDLWLRDIAPSTALRQWFGHDPARWETFRERYLEELRQGEAAAALETLRAEVAARPVLTLLYSAHDEAHNNAVALRDMLQGGG